MESILRKQRSIISACLAGIVLVSWFYLVYEQRNMPGMDMRDMSGMVMSGMVMTSTQSWTPTAVFLLFVMWSVMMVAMMLPSAAPMVFMFAAINERRRALAGQFVPVGAFVLGYLGVWTVYSLIAALAQWRMHEAALLSGDACNKPIFDWCSCIFQWTPFKHVCLSGCRSPLTFLMKDWREGTRGAVMMGLRHGTYCVGCCWMPMALLFVAGVMNLLWVGLIALFVLAEKVLPKGHLIGRIGGIAMLVTGVAVILNH